MVYGSLWHFVTLQIMLETQAPLHVYLRQPDTQQHILYVGTAATLPQLRQQTRLYSHLTSHSTYLPKTRNNQISH